MVGKNVLSGNTFTAGNVYFIAGEDDHEPLNAADRTADAQAVADAFVEPSCFAAVEAALTSQHIVLVSGPSCGKRTTALIALLRAGHTPLLELPAGTDTGKLADRIKAAVGELGPRAGILVDGVAADDLAALNELRLGTVRTALAPSAGLVLTSTATPSAHDPIAVVQADAPDAKRLLESALKSRALTGAARRAADAAIAGLPSPVSPRNVRDIVALVAAGEESVENLIAAASSTAADAALRAWTSAGRKPAEHAALAAAITLAGATLADVDECARTLIEAVEPPDRDDAPTRTRAPRPAWPSEFIRIGRGTVPTHFGRLGTDIVDIATYTREYLVRLLWRELSWDFRRPYLDWLVTCGGHRSAAVRDRAAFTAGILFAIDPIYIEREVLRPWALADDEDMASSAALALGVPVAIDQDPAAARALTRHWGSTSNAGLRRVAIEAYGSLLGTWDASAEGPARLWRIGADAPRFAPDADYALAVLPSAGAAAARVRAEVFTILAAKAAERDSQARASRTAAVALRILLLREPSSRASLTALVEREDTTFTAMATALSYALMGGHTRVQAELALNRLVDVVGSGELERDVPVRLIREMKAATAPGRRATLATRVKRVLSRKGRAEASTTAAASLHDQFFGRE